MTPYTHHLLVFVGLIFAEFGWFALVVTFADTFRRLIERGALRQESTTVLDWIFGLACAFCVPVAFLLFALAIW